MADNAPAQQPVYNVLFVCTENAARSIFAEAVLNNLSQGRLKAYSAGACPRGEVHPMTLQLLRDLRIDPAFARSKSWDEFDRQDAPHMHFLFTVCDEAAGETCPVWPGHPLTGHWGVPDPKRAEGNEAQRALKFTEAYKMLARRIGIFLALPHGSLGRLALKTDTDTSECTMP